MASKEYTIRIGGAAGQGMHFIGGLFAKYLSSIGYHVFSHQDYMSRIKGGHNFYQIRFADFPLTASRGQIDILLALNQETVTIHTPDLNEGGCLLYDPGTVDSDFSHPLSLKVPFATITEGLELDQVMRTSVAIGALLGALGMTDLGDLSAIISSFLPETATGVIASQDASIRAGLDFVVTQTSPNRRLAPLELPRENKERVLLNGNQAIGRGALVSGCKFFSAYPMTPATSIMLYLAAQSEKHGIVVEQVEDEISAINMALGASYGGVRAMTATSGGGFALMTEGLSLAGITETPLVIAEVQRPGPATGLPTRTEQSDLLFVIFSGHGEFPVVVLTPGTPEQALFLTNKAFHLAEKYQIPVIIQSDQYLADSQWTFGTLDTNALQYHNFRLQGQELASMSSYQRYTATETGVSPFAIPGNSRHLVVVDSDEHDQEGHMIEDAQTRTLMVHKRYHQKIPLIRHEISPPSFHGSPRPEIILTGYGSTFGIMREVVDLLSSQHKIAMLHFSEVFPFPLQDTFDYMTPLNEARMSICIEGNATSQFAHLMRMETGFEFGAQINKFDGRPFILDHLLGEINAYL